MSFLVKEGEERKHLRHCLCLCKYWHTLENGLSRHFKGRDNDRDNWHIGFKRMKASSRDCDYTPLEFLHLSLTYGLTIWVKHVDIKGSVSGVDKSLAPSAVVLIAFLHCPSVPVCPVHSVLKNSYGKRVRKYTIVHSVSMVAIKVRVPAGQIAF